MSVLITEVRMLALVSPVLGVVTRTFSAVPVVHPVTKEKVVHLGTDFVAPLGTPVRALADGVVAAERHGLTPGDTSTNGVLAGRTGNCVLLDHGAGVQSYYGHTGPAVKTGMRVTAGDVVGHSDGTGRITGPHLHLEVHVNGVAVDVETWAEQRGLDIGITDTNQEDDVALTSEQVQQLAAIPDLVAKVNDLVASKNQVVQPALKRIDAGVARLVVDAADDSEVTAVVAGVLAGLPPATVAQALTEAGIARAVADELARRVAS